LKFKLLNKKNLVCKKFQKNYKFRIISRWETFNLEHKDFKYWHWASRNNIVYTTCRPSNKTVHFHSFWAVLSFPLLIAHFWIQDRLFSRRNEIIGRCSFQQSWTIHKKNFDIDREKRPLLIETSIYIVHFYTVSSTKHKTVVSHDTVNF